MVKILPILFLSFIVHISFGQVASNESFLASKGKWALPINCGYIFENKEKQRLGLSIFCSSVAEVYSVFNGTVILVNEYDSLFMIVVKYADCFIGYSNLENLSVKKNDKIKAGDKIGYTAKNLDDVYGVDIDLHIKGQDLDPSAWFINKPFKTASQ